MVQRIDKRTSSEGRGKDQDGGREGKIMEGIVEEMRQEAMGRKESEGTRSGWTRREKKEEKEVMQRGRRGGTRKGRNSGRGKLWATGNTMASGTG